MSHTYFPLGRWPSHKWAALMFSMLMLMWADAVAAQDFVKTSGPGFAIDGKPFYVTGVNNHYLTYGTEGEVDRVLDDAVALGATTIRTSLQPVIGSLDGGVATIWDRNKQGETSDLVVNGNYLLYMDDHSGAERFNDGSNGMQKVDFLISEAKKRHLFLIVDFIDFWDYTGGAQQMRSWYGLGDKNAFYTDPRVKADYKAWVSHVLTRHNPLTGLQYKDDPTIMAWELMNEGVAEPDQLRVAWTSEMSEYVHSQDHNHLVGSGAANPDAGMIETELKMPSLDFATWHGYPLFVNLTPELFQDRITQYCQLATDARKPLLVEEFGWARKNPSQAGWYANWLNTMAKNCSGWLVWRLVSRQQDGNYPVDDFDQFDIHNDGTQLWQVIKAAMRPIPGQQGQATR